MTDILKITDIKCNQSFSSYTLVIEHQPYNIIHKTYISF